MLMHIYVKSRKLILINLFSCRNRDADIENRLVDTEGEVEVGQIERVALKHIHYHV